MPLPTATKLLGVPVRLRGIRLGRVADVLLDPEGARVVGFDVRCGDDVNRFLPWSAVKELGVELHVDSALPLLEDVAFYRRRARSFRALVEVAAADAQIRDLGLASDGTVTTVAVAGEASGSPESIL